MAQCNSYSYKDFGIRRDGLDTTKPSTTLVLLYGFYGASNRALQKYINIYQGYGFDVLPIKSKLKHFARPRCSEILAEETLQFVRENCVRYDHIFVHAFSMGAYNFAVCSEKMCVAKPKHDVVLNKISGIVYDSIAIGSLKGMVAGIAGGISKNGCVRWLVPKVMNSYFFVTRRCTVDVYNHVLEFCKNNPINVPMLVFYCKDDRMSNWEVIEEYIKAWSEKNTAKVQGKRWEESKHCAHLMVHEEEYIQTLNGFIGSIPCLERKIKWHTKL